MLWKRSMYESFFGGWGLRVGWGIYLLLLVLGMTLGYLAIIREEAENQASASLNLTSRDRVILAVCFLSPVLLALYLLFAPLVSR